MECQQLNLILDSGVGKNAMLAFRILTSSGKIYLEYVKTKLQEEEEAKKNSKVRKSCDFSLTHFSQSCAKFGET